MGVSRQQLPQFLSVTICYGSILLCGAALLLTFSMASVEGDRTVGIPPLRLLSARDPLKLDASTLEEQIDRARISLLTQANFLDGHYRWTGFIRSSQAFGEKSQNRIKIYTHLSVKEALLFDHFPGVISDISRSEIPFNPE